MIEYASKELEEKNRISTKKSNEMNMIDERIKMINESIIVEKGKLSSISICERQIEELNNIAEERERKIKKLKRNNHHLTKDNIELEKRINEVQAQRFKEEEDWKNNEIAIKKCKQELDNEMKAWKEKTRLLENMNAEKSNLLKNLKEKESTGASKAESIASELKRQINEVKRCFETKKIYKEHIAELTRLIKEIRPRNRVSSIIMSPRSSNVQEYY